MCPPTPKVRQLAQAPAEAPKPLANPFDSAGPLGLQALRIGTAANLKLQQQSTTSTDAASALADLLPNPSRLRIPGRSTGPTP